jgi:hypothetical protein
MAFENIVRDAERVEGASADVEVCLVSERRNAGRAESPPRTV